MKKDINFHKFFKKANLISFVLFTLSSLIIFFKGLNYGVDFKGGTLLEIQINEKNINISELDFTSSIRFSYRFSDISFVILKR